jgi:hypothetical protein
MVAPPRLVSAILILISLILPGCDGVAQNLTLTLTPGVCDGDFGSTMPKGWLLISRTVLNTGGLGPAQCVVLYRLDAQKPNDKKIAPVGGAVYREDHGGPPRWVYPHLLQLPNGLYLGEHDVKARVADALTSVDGPELIIEDIDPEGNIVEASIFGWHDSKASEPDASPDPKAMYYQLLGLFLSEGGVQVGQDVVTVTERISGTRSRLAYRKVYRLSEKSKTYFIKPDNPSKLIDPETAMVSLVECVDPNAVCYPEKTVLDFYQNVKDDVALAGLMADDALKALKEGKLKYGCPPDRSQLERALVRELKIQGSDEQPRITVTGKCRLRDASLKDMTPVTWQLEKSAGKWQLSSKP